MMESKDVSKWMAAGASAAALMTTALESFERSEDDDVEFLSDSIPIFADMDHLDLVMTSAWLSRLATQSLIHQYGSLSEARTAIREMALELARIELEGEHAAG